MRTVTVEAWGGEGSDEVSVIIGKNNDYVLNGCWIAILSEDGKNIKPDKDGFEWEEFKNTRFLGWFDVKDSDYNDMIFQVEEQIKNNPDLVSKDGICKREVRKFVKKQYDEDEEPVF